MLRSLSPEVVRQEVWAVCHGRSPAKIRPLVERAVATRVAWSSFATAVPGHPDHRIRAGRSYPSPGRLGSALRGTRFLRHID
ncbi:hypothetical protein SCNRRL3882_4986 [Streptomyces chartreusis NRRL 3882]|uniref:Uncharacterized protein n=1 Tax=Streptomyces chartreusis NRRL 3882 TaxID=1079985 RepID=A0A2N9BDT8_STRCX|nr:hypothetical protein SCNRRL3882_4986 [Streptomyces chartreusis NRRL 3882]